MGSLGVDLVELQTHGNLCRSQVRVVRARASEASTLLIQERVEIVRRNLGRFVFHGELSAEAICSMRRMDASLGKRALDLRMVWACTGINWAS